MAQPDVAAALRRILAPLQSDRRVRGAVGALLVLALFGVAGRFAWRLVPRQYTLRITGGDIVSNRHFLARVLQSEAAKRGLTLVIEPVSSGTDALDRVSQGKLDAAFVQGGLERTFPGVEHVATVMPELVHLLVKPGVAGMGDLKGRSVNMGLRNSPARDVALTLLRFTGYQEDVDYVETNFTAEQLLGLPERKMPDALLIVSSVPSYLVEILVRKHHYQVVEIPFPESLALRHGWAANGTILAYTYDLDPVVPEKNIQTVAVNMHLLASARADPEAIDRMLEVLYSPAVGNRLVQRPDESRLLVPSGFPVSAGTTQYLRRNDTFLTAETAKKLQGLFGLLMSFSGAALVLLRWLRGKPLAPRPDDPEFHGFLAEVVALERRALALESSPSADTVELRRLSQRLGELRVTMLERYPKAVLQDPHLLDRCLSTTHAAQAHVDGLVRSREGRP